MRARAGGSANAGRDCAVRTLTRVLKQCARTVVIIVFAAARRLTCRCRAVVLAQTQSLMPSVNTFARDLAAVSGVAAGDCKKVFVALSDIVAREVSNTGRP